MTCCHLIVSILLLLSSLAHGEVDVYHDCSRDLYDRLDICMLCYIDLKYTLYFDEVNPLRASFKTVQKYSFEYKAFSMQNNAICWRAQVRGGLKLLNLRYGTF